MGTYRLEADEEREAPNCKDFGDESEVRRYEREVRVHRAHVEAWVIERREARVDTTWVVHSPSGARYRVDLVDGDAHDVCECPDFLGNGLGACKHLEAVYRLCEGRASLRRARAALDAPTRPTLTLDRRLDAALTTLGTWSPTILRRVGLRMGEASGELLVEHPDRVSAAVDDGEVRVTHAAVAKARMVHDRMRLEARRVEVLGALDQGRLALDVLARPLFPYQAVGVRHLASAGRALLADDMGLGKTVQAIAACEVLRRRGEAARILVVTPASLKDQWRREIERYAGERAVVVGGGAVERRIAIQSDAPYKIVNYELTWKELTLLTELDADVLVLDEAQRARNFRTRTAATLRDLPSRFAFVLTGTPIENRLDDLYSLLQLVDPDVLGPLWRFNLNHHVRNPKGRIEGVRNLSRLRAETAPVVLRRRKEEVLTQLPAITEQTRYLPLGEQQAELELGYRQSAAQLLAMAERRPLTLEQQRRLQAMLLKARQACDAVELCDPERAPQSPKLDELTDLVGEILSQGQAKVLVFSEWVEMLRLAAKRLTDAGVGHATLHGGVPTEQRPALLQRFHDDPSVRVLLSTDAGGTGLNLQVASYVIHLDLPWNPGRLDQRNGRAHRLGQSRGVSVIYLCAEHGIERAIEATLAGKRAIRAGALDGESDLETLDVPTFTSFAQRMRAALSSLGDDAKPVAPESAPPPRVDTMPAPAMAEPAHSAITDVPAAPTDNELEWSPPPSFSSDMIRAVQSAAPAAVPPSERPTLRHASPQQTRAARRMSLARVSLDAGFPEAAVRAAYEALAAAIGRQLGADTARWEHARLVAAMHRELIPAGRLSPVASGVLARLRDLSLLDDEDVPVDPSLAREVVEESSMWVERLSADAGAQGAMVDTSSV